MIEFEYLVEDMELVEDWIGMNELGNLGWELVCCIESQGKLIFKRLVDEARFFEDMEYDKD